MFDCVIAGSCVIDVLVRPIDLSAPIGAGQLIRSDPLVLTTGGIVSNAGITMARLGSRVAAFTYVGDDPWAEVIRQRFAAEGLDASHVLTRADAATSTSAVLVDPRGERSFVHCVGAPRLLDASAFRANRDLLKNSRAFLLGYYPLLPNLLADLPALLAEIRSLGCLTALDAAGDGGDLAPLAPILPHLDLYVPSFKEAHHQTGEDDPRGIIETYRRNGAQPDALLGVKLGSRGALLSPREGVFLEVAPVAPPGEIVDTTGAGDCFLGGLLTGLLRGLAIDQAAKLAAAAGATCITALGATTAIRNYAATAKLAGLADRPT